MKIRSSLTMAHDEQGLGITELLVVVVIFAIISTTAIATVPETLASFERNQIRQQTDFDLRRIRTEAITEGARGVFRIMPGGTSYVYGIDNVPYNNPAAPDTVMVTRTMPDNITLGPVGSVIFNSRGHSVDVAGALTGANISINREGGLLFLSGTVYPIGSFEFTL